MGAAVPQRPLGQPQFESLSVAWNLLWKHASTWPLVTLIFLAVNFILNLPAQILSPAPVMTDRKPPTFDVAIDMMFANLSPFVIVFGFLATSVIFAFTAGVQRLALRLLRGGAPDIGQMFDFSHKFLNLFLCGMLITAIQWVPFFLVIPLGFWGLFLGGCFVFALYPMTVLTGLIVIEQGLDPWDALLRSIKVSAPNWIQIFLLVLISALGSALGMLACCVGVLWTFPFYLITVAAIFRDIFGDPVMMQPQQLGNQT